MAVHPFRLSRFGCVAASVLVLLAALSAAQSQTVTDGSEGAIGVKESAALLALIGRRLHSPDARVTNLHFGRAGAVCGLVDMKNRMGTYTGPRGFVAELREGFFGRLPEGPELRSPASIADYNEMERAKTLFFENCTRP